MSIPPIGIPSSGPSDPAPPTISPSLKKDERLAKVVNEALQAAWKISSDKNLRLGTYVRHLFEEATRSLMQDISLLLREKVKDQQKLPNIACEELGRMASQKAAQEGLLLHSFFTESGNSKTQQGLIKLLLAADLVMELGLQLGDKEVTKIEEAFEWAIAMSESKQETSPDLGILNEAILLGEKSLVDLLTVGYPIGPSTKEI